MAVRLDDHGGTDGDGGEDEGSPAQVDLTNGTVEGDERADGSGDVAAGTVGKRVEERSDRLSGDSGDCSWARGRSARLATSEDETVSVLTGSSNTTGSGSSDSLGGRGGTASTTGVGTGS